MVFDAINESLGKIRDQVRPRLPWEPYAVQLIAGTSIDQIKELTVAQLCRWNAVEGGKILPADEDEETVQEIREDKLSDLLTIDVLDMDKEWN
ncbi:MAG: hypothetical protein V2I33_22485 [Kangiellaceae bacterium]|jgi:hypothetical protein|nr:hypothetical protein [Kangiellaceae bacterium]